MNSLVKSRAQIRAAVVLACGVLLLVPPADGARLTFVGLQRDGVAGVNGLFTVQGVGISPDGAYVYTGSDGFDFSIDIFRRGAVSGGLAYVGVVTPSDASKFAISPDGAYLYAAAASVVEVYSRDAGTGLLTAVEDEPGGGFSLAISPDGKHLYVGFLTTLRAYERNVGTGELTFVEEYTDGMAGVDGLNRVVDVTVAPDGGHVYAAGVNDNAIAVFSRNAGTGQLTFVEIQQEGMGGVNGLAGVEGVRVSPDNKHVYASGATGGVGGVAVFSRNTTTGALTFLAHATGGSNGIGRLAISPDGQQLYRLEHSTSRLGVFARDSVSGALMFEEDLIDGVGGVEGLSGPEDIVVSPDSRHVYVAGDTTVAAFQRSNVACSPAPLGGCFAPTVSGKALLVVKDDANDAKDKLVWKWLKGDAVSLGDYGDPATTANDYALCVYDGTANPQPIAELLAPAGGGCGKAADGGGVPCWKAVATKGFKYKRNDTHPDGVVAAKLLTGAAGRSKIVLKAKKSFTPTPAVPVTLPVTVQLQNADGTCWTATYSAALINGNGLFKAKAD